MYFLTPGAGFFLLRRILAVVAVIVGKDVGDGGKEVLILSQAPISLSCMSSLLFAIMSTYRLGRRCGGCIVAVSNSLETTVDDNDSWSAVGPKSAWKLTSLSAVKRTRKGGEDRRRMERGFNSSPSRDSNLEQRIYVLWCHPSLPLHDENLTTTKKYDLSLIINLLLVYTD